MLRHLPIVLTIFAMIAVLGACQGSEFAATSGIGGDKDKDEKGGEDDVTDGDDTDGGDDLDGGDDDGGDGADGDLDEGVDLEEGDTGEDGGADDGSIDGNGDEAGVDGDLGIDEGELTIKNIPIGGDGIILYYHTSGLDLWNPAASTGVEPAGAVQTIQALGRESVAAGVALKGTWGGWGMFARQITPRITTDETTVRPSQCDAGEVVVGYPPHTGGVTTFNLICAKLKDGYEIVDRQTLTFTWDEGQSNPCPDGTVMVGQGPCQNTGCSSPSPYPQVCGKVEKVD